MTRLLTLAAVLLSIPLHAFAAPMDDFSAYNSGDQFHGIARPYQVAELPSLVPGTIAAVHVQEGQFVRQGTALVMLDDRIPRARLAAATVEANLKGGLRRAEVEQRMAQSRLNRLRSALNLGAGAQFELEEAESLLEQATAAVEQQQDELKAAEANRQLAEAQLSQYTISAPFDGLITEVHRKSGAVDPSQIVISMVNLDSLEVEMHLPSRLIGQVFRGQSVALKASPPISNIVTGSVMSASPVINSASNTFRCLIRIDNPNTQLPAGFSVVLDDSERMQRISQQASTAR